MKKQKLDGMIVSYLPAVRYLSGFSGSAGTLYVAKKGAWLVTDGRYESQVEDEVRKGIGTIIDRDHFGRLKKEKLIKKGSTIGFQENHVSVGGLDRIKQALKKKVKLVKTGPILRDILSVKSSDEIKLVRKAANIAGRVYRDILEMVKPGMREADIAAEISYLGKQYGSEGDAFDIIVASGYRSALPHGRASKKKLKKGELVTLDFGCIVDGFCSDMTRTFAIGEPGDEAREIYRIVYESERAGVEAAEAGMRARDLDKVCRDIIVDAGYGDAFKHSTGHGLGIDVHEYPGIGATSPDDTVLKEGMIITVEPGIYLSGKFGVRIEDDVLIEAEGNRELTRAARKLTIV
jgi:Xaa-Pro aminopeptidase